MAFGLAACSRQAATTSPDNHAEQATGAADRLAALSPVQRNAVIVQAIVASGNACDRVVQSRYQQQVRGLAMWNAQCHDRGYWAVYVGSQGYAQVGRCSDVPTSGLPPCSAPAAIPARG